MFSIQVERAQALASSSRGRGSAEVRARGNLQPSLRSRRHRYVPQIERSAQAELAGASRRLTSSRDLPDAQRQQLRDELREHHQDRERDRPTRSRAATGGRGSSFALQGVAARVPQPVAFAYHTASSLEMRAAAGLGGRTARGATVDPPESMVQAVQEMFGSIARDVIVRDLRATGSMEATIDRLLSRNSSGSSDTSRDDNPSSPTSSFDSSVLAALSRSAGEATGTDSPSASSPVGSSFRVASSRTVPRSQHHRSAIAVGRAGSASTDSLYGSLLSASGPVTAGAAAERETSSVLSTFVSSDIEWWDVAIRFKSIAAMASDLVAVGTDGKLYSWSWTEHGGTSNSATPLEHNRAKNLFYGESVTRLVACNTHGIGITESGKVA
eukprot:COSAG05_NODE_1652_length_4335_cov_49.472380_1_plen_383_part_10